MRFKLTLFTLLFIAMACGSSGGGGPAASNSGVASTPATISNPPTNPIPSTPNPPPTTPTVPPSPPSPPPTNSGIPAPSGQIVAVANEADLQFAVRTINSNTTIQLSAGTYRLTSPLNISGGVQNVQIRGETGIASDVVIMGPGMTVQPSNGGFFHGIMVSDATDVLIASLTIRDVYHHPITLQAAQGCERVKMMNLRLINAGEQFIKSNSGNNGVNDCLVENCVMEYETTARSWYTNGVDVHTGNNWIIRGCTFRNIRGPAGSTQGAGPAILMWNNSENTLVENNLFINCERGVAFGLSSTRLDDHVGGMIRNNTFYRSAAQSGDVGISLTNAPNAKVLHNTVLLSGTYPNAIEYRFTNTSQVLIQNNFCDALIQQRNGASALVISNREDASPGDFINIPGEDFHLNASSRAIDQGQSHSDALVDRDGQARPTQGSVDLGADERQ